MNVNHGANLYDLSDKFGFSKEEFMDFSSNINPLGSSKLAKDYITNNIDMVSMYPDPDYINLKKSISTYCNCDKDNIILGSGATELISAFIQNIKPSNTLLISPAYSEYEKELNKVNSNITKYYSKAENNFKINIDKLLSTIQNNNYELIVICNPNNPTGFTLSKSQIEQILSSTDAFVMVDETYIEFTDTNIFSSTKLVDIYSNLFVIRGTSKFFSTPGIRLGYGLISNDIVKNKIKSNLDLWNINIFASAMGEIMFVDDEFIKTTSDTMLEEREYLTKNLSSLNELQVYESHGNFILCNIKSKKITAKELRETLMPNRIIIRDCASFDGLDEYYFRVCILKPEQNKILISNLNRIFT